MTTVLRFRLARDSDFYQEYYVINLCINIEGHSFTRSQAEVPNIYK